ncbi:MAG: FecR family protein [Elusimicrobia bacterium]|nr:MAG: FecR family protein [Elusimicrobiota bacterium]KAF0156625.1 MAG: FecR family protein [Elusimicrobiota bacterium]
MKYLILAALLPAAASPASAEGPAAALYSVKGGVQLKQPGGDWLPAPRAAELIPGSALRTARKASADVLYADGTMVRLNEDSEMELEDLRLSDDERSFSVKVLAGKFLFMAAKARHRFSRFAVRTPSAVCAVRGTDFAVIVGPEAAEIGLFDGALEVTAEGEPGILSPGQQATAAGGAVEISPRFTKVMDAERRRYEKLRSYVRKTREKLDKREDFLREHIGEREKKLDDFDRRREEKLGREKKGE